MFDMGGSIDAGRIDESIDLLKQHVQEPEIKPMLEVLESMSENPYDYALLDRLSEEFGKLGFLQGAVLTYAPYISTILPDDPFPDLVDDPFDDEV
jgi:hypothetical protein